ncbi:DUF6188 family protein [Streptomyces erythrochromogenes]|uniref:DUF6188 family protein n=1 Tax=Streptomyces erythrochromogenes TaxID=285574 RepID=A0ABZ1QDG9_9ACTN|nr:DUF6188 family protein [Streptomyces erythrochromogenes]
MNMATTTPPVEGADRWILNLRGLAVTRIGIDFRLTLVLDGGWEVVLEAPARLSVGALGSRRAVIPEIQDVAAALPLFGAEVASAVAFKSGSLRMVFDSGLHLVCPAVASFEAWQVTGPQGRRFVSLPGGGLATWGTR